MCEYDLLDFVVEDCDVFWLFVVFFDVMIGCDVEGVDVVFVVIGEWVDEWYWY